jgi:hypothetical protein
VPILAAVTENVSSEIVGIISMYYVLSAGWLEIFTAAHWTAV